MFTPPPSPLPLKKVKQPESPLEPLPQVDEKGASHLKRQTGRRTKWVAMLVPLALILATISLRCLAHRPLLSLYSSSPLPTAHTSPNGRRVPDATSAGELKFERRQQNASSASSDSLSPTRTTTTLAGTAQALPTIPVNPVLPTPFPQPWDNGFYQNATSTACVAFFANMTSSPPFRACRPFSLLSQSSTALVLAQRNLTLLNSIIYGTCQTTVDAQQCSSNMGWFAESLKVACPNELKNNNADVSGALTGLLAYDLMREAGCLADPVTNTYCYLNAAHNSNPSDLYFYQLPLGLPIPKSSIPTCSSCTKNLLALYSDAMNRTPEKVATLGTTYKSGWQLTSNTCGKGYAAEASIDSNGALPLPASRTVLVLSLMMWLSSLLL